MRYYRKQTVIICIFTIFFILNTVVFKVSADESGDVKFKASFTVPACNVIGDASYNLGSLRMGAQQHSGYSFSVNCTSFPRKFKVSTSVLNSPLLNEYTLLMNREDGGNHTSGTDILVPSLQIANTKLTGDVDNSVCDQSAYPVDLVHCNILITTEVGDTVIPGNYGATIVFSLAYY
ncbi:hypothetical protein IHA49_002676 [Salmonella enterica]|nr:hypothetical protein [Salmonella enterica]EGJ0496217.1 hypothetical protein [Salmonella enterica]EGL9362499.1 hypothetical protein [Salmonella enterica]EGL9530115.1 hypothetical protein [Salmonella enterica]EGL9745799.1 hypothetical protein [Salmonella enterica]